MESTHAQERLAGTPGTAPSPTEFKALKKQISGKRKGGKSIKKIRVSLQNPPVEAFHAGNHALRGANAFIKTVVVEPDHRMTIIDQIGETVKGPGHSVLTGKEDHHARIRQIRLPEGVHDRGRGGLRQTLELLRQHPDVQVPLPEITLPGSTEPLGDQRCEVENRVVLEIAEANLVRQRTIEITMPGHGDL